MYFIMNFLHHLLQSVGLNLHTLSCFTKALTSSSAALGLNRMLPPLAMNSFLNCLTGSLQFVLSLAAQRLGCRTCRRRLKTAQTIGVLRKIKEQRKITKPLLRKRKNSISKLGYTVVRLRFAPAIRRRNAPIPL